MSCYFSILDLPFQQSKLKLENLRIPRNSREDAEKLVVLWHASMMAFLIEFTYS